MIADASIIGNILLIDEQADQNDTLLEFVFAADLVEPVHWPIESCGLLLEAARRRRLEPNDRDSALAQARSLIALAEVESVARINAVIDLALSFHISIYDAAYLELALRTGLPLVSSDKGLRAAATKAKVTLVPLI